MKEYLDRIRAMQYELKQLKDIINVLLSEEYKTTLSDFDRKIVNFMEGKKFERLPRIIAHLDIKDHKDIRYATIALKRLGYYPTIDREDGKVVKCWKKQYFPIKQ